MYERDNTKYGQNNGNNNHDNIHEIKKTNKGSIVKRDPIKRQVNPFSYT